MKAHNAAMASLVTIAVPTVQKVRWSAITFTLLLVAAFTAASGWSSLTRYEIMGTGYLPRSVVPLFLLIVLINAGLRFFSPSLALSRSELLFVFAILSSIAAVSGQEFANHFYLNLLGLVYYSSPQSQWFNAFTPHLQPYLVPSLNFRDPAILWAYEGMPEGARLPLSEWLVPLLVWTPYLLGIYALSLSLCLIFSRQWEEHERLLYPLTQVPVELSGSDERPCPTFLFRSPLFWLGFVAAALPYALRALHLYFPSIPDPQPQRNSGVLFPSGPLTAFNNLELHYYPEMVGIAYLLSSEVGLSLWLFPFIRRGEVAARMAMGMDMYHSEFLTFQSVAAYLVMAASLLWVARGYLKEILVATFRLLAKVVNFFARRSETSIPLPASAEAKALLGTIVVFAGLLAWAKWVAGVSIGWVSMLLLGLLVTGLVVARVVAEAGVYIYSPPFRVYQVMFDAFGKNRIGARNIALLTAMSWAQLRSTATMATGYFVNSLKLGSLCGLGRLTMATRILVAVFVAMIVCHVTFPAVIYSYSVPKLSWWAQTSSLNTANLIGQYLTTSRPLTPHHWWGLIIGAATCWLLIKLRLSFVGFPLHPIGFITWFGWPLDRYWLSVLLGWALKAVVLRYGGFSVFQKAKPFAYGLVVGGTTNLTFWILLRLLFPTSDVIIRD
jgi:hypothetical protein